MKYTQVIQHYADISQEAWHQLVYEIGVDFIYWVESEDYIRRTLERSPLFWAWFKGQMEQLAKEFVNINGFDILKGYKAAVIRHHFEAFARRVRVSNHGVDSYVYLVNQVIPPVQDKQQKVKIN